MTTHHEALHQNSYEKSAQKEPFHADEENFQRLRGDVQAVRGNAGVWDTDYTLEKYTAATDRIVGILDGSIEERARLDPENPERSREKPDTIIWLDKSARPVSWFVDAFWEQFTEKDTQRPTDEFLNIDRVNWFRRQGHSQIDAERRLGPNDFNINKVSKEDIARLRALFTIGDLSEDNWQDEVWNLPTRLDSKKVLVIDEVKNKGGTLAIATQLLKTAIPEATVSGDYFWQTQVYAINKQSAEAVDQQMESAPVWYNSESSLGRGVGEISTDYYDHLYETDPTQANLKLKIGSFALSAPHHSYDYTIVEDKLAKKLEQDIAYLSYAVADQQVVRNPSKDRPINQFRDILRRQNLTIAESRQRREAQEKQFHR